MKCIGDGNILKISLLMEDRNTDRETIYQNNINAGSLLYRGIEYILDELTVFFGQI